MGTVCLRLAAATSALLAVTIGCGTQSRIEKLYQDPSTDGIRYQKLLVVGIAGDGAGRRTIEELIVANLADEGIAAVAGYTRLGTSAVLLQDAIDEAAATTRSDAVLIAHLVSASVDPKVREGRVEVKSECRGGNPVDFFLYDHKELREPDSVTFAHEVTMVTNLYDARTGKRMWTIQSTCFDKAHFDAVLRQEAQAIVRQLRRDGLVAAATGSRPGNAFLLMGTNARSACCAMEPFPGTSTSAAARTTAWNPL
jgi:hypothetical protein